MISNERFEQVEVTSVTALRTWLQQHHQQSESVWLVTYKKLVPAKYVSVKEVLDELLCFGWIDGMRRQLDAQRTMQLISPRRSQHWSGTYKTRYAQLLAMGRVAPAGMEAVARSQAAGLWHLTDAADALEVPAGLRTLLQQQLGAHAFFEALPPSARRFALRWIALAKTDATRSRRMEQVANLAAAGRRVPGS